MKKLIIMCAVMVVMATTGAVRAGIIIFDNQTDLLSVAVNPVTYDFERSSGFPASGGHIGNFDGINFGATTYGTATLATSGVQTMTGAGINPTFSIATLDFTGLALQPIGFGFYGLDLTTIGPEVIRVNVDFTTGPTVSYDVQLPPGALSFTPVYFGLLNTADTIESIELFGTEVGSSIPFRAWLIDDLTVVPVPIPGAVLLGILGLSVAGVKLRKFS